MEKHPENPTVEGIVSNIISGAKEQASESELEEIHQLIDSSGLDIWWIPFPVRRGLIEDVIQINIEF